MSSLPTLGSTQAPRLQLEPTASVLVLNITQNPQKELQTLVKVGTWNTTVACRCWWLDSQWREEVGAAGTPKGIGAPTQPHCSALGFLSKSLCWPMPKSQVHVLPLTAALQPNCSPSHTFYSGTVNGSLFSVLSSRNILSTLVCLICCYLPS